MAEIRPAQLPSSGFTLLRVCIRGLRFTGFHGLGVLGFRVFCAVGVFSVHFVKMKLASVFSRPELSFQSVQI